MSLCYRNVRERRGCASEAAKSGSWIGEVSNVATLFEPKFSPTFHHILLNIFIISLQTPLKLIDPSDEINLSQNFFFQRLFLYQTLGLIRNSLQITTMRFWSSLTSHFHTHSHSHHNRVNSQTSELSDIAKGKQPENVDNVDGRKTVHSKKGGRTKGGRLLKKNHDRSSVERLRKSVDA